MSGTDKDSPAYRRWLHSIGYPYRRDHAPSSWNRQQRREERTKAKQAIRNGDEPTPYHRPYYW
ncbi:hypothetical protein FK530_23075 [Tsukamurella conjunctivitidis]|uniref:Uncharacterized protein n=1 Tax=Tsukamurella conjunctivitidis TaxID=2592068 RepID=A0A5C5RTZ5_9ACTN|nr:hypothetical protein [Tsukamurella conjunctivitidis]TWS25605.1 hypothetical protein FK530_23075 [Tsukamurella conjunctivitidis]